MRYFLNRSGFRRELRRLVFLLAGSFTLSIPAAEPEPLELAGESYPFKSVELALREMGRDSFSKNGDITARGKLLEAMAGDAATALAVFHYLNDSPAGDPAKGWDGNGYRSLYERDMVGITGPYVGLLSNDAMIEVAGAVNGFAGEARKAGYAFNNGIERDAWREEVVRGLAATIDENGFISSAQSDRRWEFGFQFHLIRKRIHWFNFQNSSGQKVDANRIVWPGGPDGAGSRLLKYVLTDPYAFVTPQRPGDSTRILEVDRDWARQQDFRHKENPVRIAGDRRSAEFEIGLFTAWRTAQPSYHGTWDGLVVINKLFEANGESVFALLSPADIARVKYALSHLATKLDAPADSSLGLDYSGYDSEDMIHWRDLCKEEIGKAGVEWLLGH